MELRLIILTPQKKYFDNLIDSLTVTTSDGQITILSNHAKLIANLEISVMAISYRGRSKHFAIGGGVIDVADNVITLILNSIQSSDEIDVNVAIEEKKKAEKLLLDSKTGKEHSDAEARLKKVLVQIDVSSRGIDNA
ncbi:MAG: ATP synthase F1 subunit epsilon [Bacilli bacterium]